MSLGPSPRRVRLSRTKGFRLPPNTVVVSRPSKWGNPFKAETRKGITITREEAVDLYAELLTTRCRHLWPEIRQKLGGKNLACWCPLDGRCHADTLLRIANDLR